MVELLAIVVLFLLPILYAGYVALCCLGWKCTRAWQIPDLYQPGTKVSIVVAARNEAPHIEACLRSLLKQNYPKDLYEIILADDHSEDDTLAIARIVSAEASNMYILPMNNDRMQLSGIAFKKLALDAAIRRASGELIVTTDADCIAQPEWLRDMVSLYQQKQAALIAGPVLFHREKKTFERFQSLDFLGMMGVTAAGIRLGTHYMANGANMAYPKAVFEAVNGFEGSFHLASGDDIFLIHKVAQKFPGRIFFLKSKNSAVLTLAQSELSAFIWQRIRWAAKTKHYDNPGIPAILGMVFLFCWVLLLSPVVFVLSGEKLFVFFFLFGIFIKSLVDFCLLNQVASFFGRRDLLQSFFCAQWLHILYVAVVGVFSVFNKSFEWKNRKVR